MVGVECKSVFDGAIQHLQMADHHLRELISEPQHPTFHKNQSRLFFVIVTGAQIENQRDIPVITHWHYNRGKCYTYFAAWKVEDGTLRPSETVYHMRDVAITFNYRRLRRLGLKYDAEWEKTMPSTNGSQGNNINMLK